MNLAIALQNLGLKKGDVVTLSSENRFEFTVSALAIMYSGGILSTLNVLYAPGIVITFIILIVKQQNLVPINILVS